MAETVVLDPEEIATGRTELSLSEDPIQVLLAGVDWGSAAIEAAMADQRRGSRPVDFSIPNRQITIPLRLGTASGKSFDRARAQLQMKVARIQEEGGWLKRELGSGLVVYADLVGASLKLGGGWLTQHRNLDIDAELQLEALPEFYEAEVSLDSHSETTLPELTIVESGIRGDMPARCRIEVTNGSSTSLQRTLLWGLRARHYDDASTAKLAYHAKDLTALDVATKSALSGAAGGTVVKHSSLPTAWTPVCGLQLAAGTHLTHVGRYRVLARLHTTTGSPVQARLVWDVGDLINPSVNEPWEASVASQFLLADLGVVALDRMLAGDHRWDAQIQGRGPGALSVDRIWLFPVDEGHGELRASANATMLGDWSVKDGFDQSAGALAGKTAAIGGTWSSGGATTDLAVDATDHVVKRAAAGRREATVGPTLTGTIAEVRVRTTVAQGKLALLSRFDSSLDYVELAWLPDDARFTVGGMIDGSPFTLFSSEASPFFGVVNTWYTLRLVIASSGRWAAYWGIGGGEANYELASGFSADLAAGGDLASGLVGIADVDSAGASHIFDDIAAGELADDAVLFASQGAELRTDGVIREDSAGAAYGRVSSVYGDLPRLPPSGLDSRSVEMLIKASRGEVDGDADGELPDSGIDDITAQVHYSPCWLFVPDDEES